MRENPSQPSEAANGAGIADHERYCGVVALARRVGKVEITREDTSDDIADDGEVLERAEKVRLDVNEGRDDPSGASR